MKFELPMLAGLALFTSELCARIAVQGFEQALVSAVVERGIGALKAVKGCAVWLREMKQRAPEDGHAI